jgi:O-antigen ligase
MSIFTEATVKKYPEQLLMVLFGVAPLFLVTVRFWSSAVLILGALFSLIFLLFGWKSTEKSGEVSSSIVILVTFTLLAPFCSIALSSLLRGEGSISEYDSASRFMVASIIFFYALNRSIDIANLLQYTAPASLVVTLLHQLYFFQPKLWGAERMSTYFSDPLVFGYTSLTLGLISLVSVNLLKRDSAPLIVYKLIGAFIGFYLSIMSGSRTGWLAVPIVFTIWLIIQLREAGPKRNTLVYLFAVLALIGTISLFSSTVSQRIEIAVKEISDYSWTGLAPETSVGLRITFLRIAWDMFWSHPLVGYGETRSAGLIFPKHIFSYATPESIRVAMTAGFHNEMVTAGIRYGVVGLMATFLLFVSPLFVFMRQIRSSCLAQRGNALIGIVLTLCIFVSSLSTEVFDLKYTASFYASMIALLCASALARHSSENSTSIAAGSSCSYKV